MREGFYLYYHKKLDEYVLYEYRYGILSYYNNHIVVDKELYKVPDYGWFLSLKDMNKFIYNVEFLEGL